jgi:hypothetical protein
MLKKIKDIPLTKIKYSIFVQIILNISGSPTFKMVINFFQSFNLQILFALNANIIIFIIYKKFSLMEQKDLFAAKIKIIIGLKIKKQTN